MTTEMIDQLVALGMSAADYHRMAPTRPGTLVTYAGKVEMVAALRAIWESPDRTDARWFDAVKGFNHFTGGTSYDVGGRLWAGELSMLHGYSSPCEGEYPLTALDRERVAEQVPCLLDTAERDMRRHMSDGYD